MDDDFVNNLNIKRFQELLKTPLDEQQRKIVEELLAAAVAAGESKKVRTSTITESLNNAPERNQLDG